MVHAAKLRRTSPRRRQNRRLFLLLNALGLVLIALIVFQSFQNKASSRECSGFGGLSAFPGPSADGNADIRSPKLALLLSFPNSGTSFTLRLVRTASNTTTATNYAKETKEARQQGYDGSIPTLYEDCTDCPMLHDSDLPKPKDYVLVKTHCSGYAAGQKSNESSIVCNHQDFIEGCLTPYKLVTHRGKDGRIKQAKACSYAPNIVHRAIHIMRNPFDNAVSRFHLWKKNYDAQKLQLPINATSKNGNAYDPFPRSEQGFKRWCRLKDEELANSQDSGIFLDFVGYVPCFTEFYRWTQWHNNAFHVTSGGISSHFLYYEQFETEFNKTMSTLFDFLHVDHKHEALSFIAGKKYSTYYTEEERADIGRFIKHFASNATWKKIRNYNYNCFTGAPH